MVRGLAAHFLDSWEVRRSPCGGAVGSSRCVVGLLIVQTGNGGRYLRSHLQLLRLSEISQFTGCDSCDGQHSVAQRNKEHSRSQGYNSVHC